MLGKSYGISTLRCSPFFHLVYLSTFLLNTLGISFLKFVLIL